VNALSLLRLGRPRAVSSLALGALVVLTGVGLTVTSNVLIARAGFHPGLETLSLLIVGVRFFGIARAAMRYLERLVSHDLTFRALAALRVRLFTRLEGRSPLQLTLTRGGDALEGFLGDVETLQNAGLALVHPWLGTTALIGFVACGVIVPALAGRASRRLGARLTELRAEHTARLQDALEGAQDLLTLGATKYERDALEVLTRAIAVAQTRLGRDGALASTASNGTAWLTALALIVVAAPLSQSGLVPLEVLGALAFGTLASFEALLPLGAAAPALERTRSAATRVLQNLETPSSLPSPTESILPTARSTLRFENVSLVLDGAPVLEEVSFTLEPGRWLAVIGHTGAGKSTLARLALRFCDPARGRVTLGGEDLRDWQLEALRDAVAWMPQRGHVFDTTVRHNLLVARPNANDDELWAALETAELASTIGELPHGLDTALENDGSRLSGGERQRLLLARALLRDASVLILDEPTANLDAETERDLMRTLRRVTRDKAVLLITHRLNILESDEDTLALEAGRVVARGKAGSVLRDWL
jgi:ATP-binding cassette, subfamily C, bacterial CydC